jgi:hypothetical protein
MGPYENVKECLYTDCREETTIKNTLPPKPAGIFLKKTHGEGNEKKYAG